MNKRFGQYAVEEEGAITAPVEAMPQSRVVKKSKRLKDSQDVAINTEGKKVFRQKMIEKLSESVANDSEYIKHIVYYGCRGYKGMCTEDLIESYINKFGLDEFFGLVKEYYIA